MIDITDSTERCFAEEDNKTCKLLYADAIESCGCKCPFYKPEGCEDWIKIEKGEGVYLYTPEEMGL